MRKTFFVLWVSPILERIRLEGTGKALLLSLFLMGCSYHVDRDIDYGWFTVSQHDTEYPNIINNLKQTLTVEIYVPDADFNKWFKYKTLVIKPHSKAQGVKFLRLDLIYYHFWVIESHKVDTLGSEGKEL